MIKEKFELQDLPEVLEKQILPEDTLPLLLGRNLL